FTDVGQMLAAPEQFALDQEARHAEYAGRLRSIVDRFVFAAAFIRQIRVEAGHVRAGFGERRGDHLAIFEVKLTSPEALENPIMVGAELSRALALRPQHSDRGDRGVPYFARPQNNEAAFARLPPAIHV